MVRLCGFSTSLNEISCNSADFPLTVLCEIFQNLLSRKKEFERPEKVFHVRAIQKRQPSWAKNTFKFREDEHKKRKKDCHFFCANQCCIWNACPPFSMGLKTSIVHFDLKFYSYLAMKSCLEKCSQICSAATFKKFRRPGIYCRSREDWLSSHPTHLVPIKYCTLLTTR